MQLDFVNNIKKSSGFAKFENSMMINQFDPSQSASLNFLKTGSSWSSDTYITIKNRKLENVHKILEQLLDKGFSKGGPPFEKNPK